MTEKVAAMKRGTSMSSISYHPMLYRITIDGKMSRHSTDMSR